MRMANNKIKNKLVYFNTENDKEAQILKWSNDSLLGFSGLVKQLLYKEMLREKKECKDLED